MHPEKGLLCQFVFQTEILLIRLYFKSKYQIVLLLNFQVFEKEHWGGKNRERRKEKTEHLLHWHADPSRVCHLTKFP